MTANGRLTASQLVEVEKGVVLSTLTARAYRRAKAFFYDFGVDLDIARPAGGYRSISVQSAMYAAANGTDIAAKRRWNLSTTSTVKLAKPGQSSHGDGTRVDLLINGKTPNLNQRAFLAMFGFTREFGSSDENHFQHDGHTMTNAVSRDFCLKHKLFVQPQ